MTPQQSTDLAFLGKETGAADRMRRVLPVGSVSVSAVAIANKHRRHAARVAAGVAFLPPAIVCRCALPDGLFVRRARTVVCARCHLVVPREP